MMNAEAQAGRFPKLLQAAIDAFSLPDLRAKILFTLAILALYRFIAHIPLPGIDQVQLDNLFRNNELLGFLDLFSGGALSRMSIVALGVFPYITSSIIIQLLTPVIPSLQEMSREGEAGFRARESRALCGALALDRCVIALGGGALEEPANRRLLSESALVVLLWGSLQRLQDRATSIGRPLLRAGAEPAALLQRRLPRYLAAADLVMPIQDSSPEQLAARLEMELSRAGLGA